MKTVQSKIEAARIAPPGEFVIAPSQIMMDCDNTDGFVTLAQGLAPSSSPSLSSSTAAAPTVPEKSSENASPTLSSCDAATQPEAIPDLDVSKLMATGEPPEAACLKAVTHSVGEFDEAARLEALESYARIEKWMQPDESLQALVQLCADICDAPISIITILDGTMQRFAASVGVPAAASPMPRGSSFCTLAIRSPKEFFMIEDLTQDDRTRFSPHVTGGLCLRSYAAMCLLDEDTNQALGTICCCDTKPRKFSPLQQASLRLLSRLVMTIFQSRRRVQQLIDMKEILRQSNERAEKALAKADKAMSAKTEFLNSMSHEIRTPMNAVLGISRLLSSTALTLEQQQYVSMITDSGTLLLTIINDVLDYSKMEAGQLQLLPKWSNIVDTIEATVLMVHNLADAKGLNLQWEIDPSMPSQMYIDSSRLQQITLNLLSNAIKFTKQGTVEVKVSGYWLPLNHDLLTQTPPVLTPTTYPPVDGASATDSPVPLKQGVPNGTASGVTIEGGKRTQLPPRRYRLNVYVRDEGIGISSAQLQNLFVSFGQVHSSGTNQSSGTG